MKNQPSPDDKALQDPLSGEPDYHPVATGVGAASGAAVGAGIGAVGGGPIGAVVGGAVGALVGGFAGKAFAGDGDFPDEAVHWEQHFRREPYFHSGFTFADYWPAYLFGLDYYRRDVDFEQAEAEAEADMEHAWEQRRGESRLSWTQARDAARASWHRLDGASGFTSSS
ncbi:hypothetical protein [Luteolibacter soli]|uniref:Glycine zipper domain-containing protein n=1 Tax=Luteolibacter soli TaxID=3135280 RepID=A0ABU9B073_9BACT